MWGQDASPVFVVWDFFDLLSSTANLIEISWIDMVFTGC